MTNVAPGIVTYGLGGDHSNIILGGRFGFFDGIIVIPPPPVGGGGGTTARPTYIPRPDYDEDDYPPERKIEVTIKVRFGRTPVWREHTYWVLPKKVTTIVKVLNFVNATRSRMAMVATGLQNKLKSAIMTITNIKNKGDKK